MNPSHDPSDPEEATLLVVDDLPANRELLRQTLEPMGCEILLASDGEAAIRVATRGKPDLILLDVMMPGITGYEACQRLKASEATRDIPVIFITAQHETASILEGFRAGGVDYITKPFQTEEVRARVTTHLRVSQLTRALMRKNEELQAEVQKRHTAEEALATADETLSLLSEREAKRWGVSGLLGKSPTFTKIVEDIRKAQQVGTVSVLITGESGTGKELIARAIHEGGVRAKGPFIPINCSAVPPELAESFFFGHSKGSFSGAHSDQKGCFELAHGGTLFLDEIGDMPVALQPKLLRVLEDGKVMPLGATKERKLDVRVVSATNADFPKKIAAGTFRQDLFFRLARFTVTAPPLRERPEDIPLLAAHFVKVVAAEMGRPTPPITPPAMAALSAHAFPGNVRELKNLIERALIESGGDAVRPEHLKFIVQAAQTPAADSGPSVTAPQELPLNLEQAERLLIQRALAQSQGNVSKAADLLGVNRARIYRTIASGGEGDPDPK